MRNCPFSQHLKDVLVNAHVQRVVLIGPFVWVVICLAGATFSIRIIGGNLIVRVVVIIALERMLRVRLKQGPACIKVDIDIKLSTVLEVLYICAVNTDDVANLPHNWTIFKPACIDNDHRMLQVLILQRHISYGVKRAIDDLEGADPFTLAALDWVSCVDNHAVHIELVSLFCIQRMVLHLIRPNNNIINRLK